MISKSHLPKRRSVRLPLYDYASAGAYFITVCTHERKSLFGDISGGEVQPSELGRCVTEGWSRMLELRPYVRSEAFVVMPNHVHALFLLLPKPECDVAGVAGLGFKARSVSSIIAAFKAGVTREVRKSELADGPVWQRGFHEHVIRSQRAFDQIRQYIHENPLRWEMDRYHVSLDDGQQG